MLQAIGDRIIVHLDEQNESMLILPDDRSIISKGIVESTGDAVQSVKIGDHVEFHRFDEIPLFENRVVIRENSVLGVYCE